MATSPATKRAPKSIYQRKSVLLVATVSVLLALAWNFVDANATLWMFDTLLSATVSTEKRFHKFKDKTVWVTGASSGIGAELVCLLTEAQAGHIILSSRHEEKLQQVVQTCLGRASRDRTVETNFSILPFDAASPKVDHVVKGALAMSGGGIDVVILNAGIYQLKPALETELDHVQRIMKVNFETPVALAATLVREDRWKERGNGHIMVVSSLIGRGANSLTSAYSASKHALRGYFHSLSTEEHSWLRVDVATPGAVDTALWTTGFNNTTIESSPSIKLDKHRCAWLILTGMTGPHFLFYETWMSKPLGLIWLYLSLFPNLFHWFIHFLGTLRVSAYEEDGYDALDLPTLVRQTIKLVQK